MYSELYLLVNYKQHKLKMLQWNERSSVLNKCILEICQLSEAINVIKSNMCIKPDSEIKFTDFKIEMTERKTGFRRID